MVGNAGGTAQGAARTDEHFDSGLPKTAATADADAMRIGGEGVGNTGDIVSTGSVQGAKIVDGEAAGNRGDPLLNLPGGKVAVSADIILPAKGSYQSEGDYSLTKTPYKESSTGTFGSQVKNIEESLINIGSPPRSVTDGKLGADTALLPGVQNVEESVINIGGSATLPGTASSDYGSVVSKGSAEPSGSYVGNIEESTINIGEPGSKISSGSVLPDGTGYSAPTGTSPHLGKIEESVINIGSAPSGPANQDSASTGPYLGNIEESTINIGGKPITDQTQNTGSSSSTDVYPGGRPSSSSLQNIEESVVNIGKPGPGAQAAPGGVVKNIEESTVNLGVPSGSETRTFNKPSVTNIEESTINISKGPSSNTGYGKDGQAPGKKTKVKVQSIEESVVNIGSPSPISDNAGMELAIPEIGGSVDSGPHVKNIEESTININGKPVTKSGTAFEIPSGRDVTNGATVQNIEESTINIGYPHPVSSQDIVASAEPSTGTSPYVNNIEESSVNIGGTGPEKSSSGTGVDLTSGPFVSNIEESTVNVHSKSGLSNAGTDLSANPEPGSGTSVKNIEESTVNLGSQSYPSSPDVGAVAEPSSGSGGYLKNIEESTINIKGPGVGADTTGPYVNKIEETVVNIRRRSVPSGYLPPSPKSIGTPDGAVVRNIEESTVNIHDKPSSVSGAGLVTPSGGAHVQNIEESTINVGRQGYPSASDVPFSAEPTSSSGTFVKNIEESTINIGGVNPVAESKEAYPTAKPADPYVNNVGESVVSVVRRSVPSGPIVGVGSQYAPSGRTHTRTGSDKQSLEKALIDTGLSSLSNYKKPSTDLSFPSLTFNKTPVIDAGLSSSVSKKSGTSAGRTNKDVVSNIEESVININGPIPSNSQSIPQGSVTNGAHVQSIEESTINIHGGAGLTSGSSMSGLTDLLRRKSGAFVKNIEESVINIGGKAGSSATGKVIITSVSRGHVDVPDVPDLTGYTCIQYPYKEEGELLVFEGIDYNCEL